MDFVGGEAVRVHELLRQYFDIHERTFKFSFRKVLPIPGLFEALDYRAYQDSLRSIHGDLILAADALAKHRQSGAPLSDHPFVPDLEAYAREVADAARRLGEICLALQHKSEARRGYNAATYKSEVTAYKAVVATYHEMGGRLNVSFAAYRGVRTPS